MVIRLLYNRFVRPYTPRKIAVFNGVAVRDVRLFDATDVIPDYEAPLINAIKSQVREGQDIVIIGGGRGVSSVVAAYRTGPTGTVTAYEGSTDRAALVEETVSLNEVNDLVQVRHAVVGDPVSLADDPGEADPVSPEDLPDCNVLILDCEGAETEILETVEALPPLIIVETHEFLDSPEAIVRRILDDRGYDVINRGIEDEERGVYVLTAVDRKMNRSTAMVSNQV